MGGLPKASLIVCELGQECRTGKSANIQAAGKRSVSMANHLLLLIVKRDVSLL